jgi:hypothetical protein
VRSQAFVVLKYMSASLLAAAEREGLAAKRAVFVDGAKTIIDSGVHIATDCLIGFLLTHPLSRLIMILS